MKFFKNKKGFTLVELVVVIAILGILAGIAVPRFMDATATARGSKIVADLRTIDSAVTMYLAANGDTVAPTAGTSSNLAPKYIASWPTPPSGTAKIATNGGSLQTITAATGGYTLGTSANGYRALYGSLNADDISKLGNNS